MNLFHGDPFAPSRPWRGLRAFVRAFVQTWAVERFWAKRARAR